MGIPYTRNIGLKEAKGKYMAIMDSDDIAFPHRIERQVEYLETHHDIDAVSNYYIKFNKNKKKEMTTSFISPEEICIMLLFFNPIANPSATVRLQTIKKHSIQYKSNYFIGEDYDLWVQLSKVGKLTIIPEFLLMYRSGHENITKKSKQEKMMKRKHIIDEIHKDLLDFYHIPLSSEEIEVYYELFSNHYSYIQDVGYIYSVINSLKNWNQENMVFDNKKFLNVLSHCTYIGLTNQQFGLNQKLKLYQSLIVNKNIKQFLYLTIKHFYIRMKR